MTGQKTAAERRADEAAAEEAAAGDGGDDDDATSATAPAADDDTCPVCKVLITGEHSNDDCERQASTATITEATNCAVCGQAIQPGAPALEAAYGVVHRNGECEHQGAAVVPPAAVPLDEPATA